MDKNVKAVLLGACGVGKTSLLAKKNEKDINLLNSTVSPLPSTSHIEDCSFNTKKLGFQIWDTPGQDKFQAVTDNVIRGSQVVYILTTCGPKDENNPEISKCDEDLKLYLKRSKEILGGDKYVIIILINKCDLIDQSEYDERKKQVLEIARNVYPEFDKDYIYFTSCKSGENCDFVLRKGFEEGYYIKESNNTQTISISEQSEQQDKPKPKFKFSC